MACRRFAGGWRHKKRVERASTQAHDGHFCINAAGKIQPHLDVIVIRQQRIIQHPMRGVKVHVVGQGENQRRIADSFPNLVDAGTALVGHDHHHIGFIIHEHHRPDFVLHLHRAPFRIGERHLPRAA